jgi:hypothetical protein
MKFGHLEQKLELSNQSICKKLLKNNAHIGTLFYIPSKNISKIIFAFIRKFRVLTWYHVIIVIKR